MASARLRTLARRPTFAEPAKRILVCEALESRVMLTASPIGPQQVLAVSEEAHAGPLTTQAVAAAADGSFVAVWQGWGQDPPDVNGSEVYARRFEATGAARGAAFRVNTATESDQVSPVVAMTPAGDFVVAWLSLDFGGYNIYAQRFNPAGQRQGGEIHVNEVSTLWTQAPQIGINASGQFVVTWAQADGIPGDTEYDVYARKFDAGGAPVRGADRVNAFTDYGQLAGAVAVAPDGSYVVAWQTNQQETNPFDYSVRARRFAADTTPLGDEIPVSMNTQGRHGSPAIGVGGDGRYLVAWDAAGSVRARYLDAAGATEGDSIVVSQAPEGAESFGSPSLSQNASGDAVIAWLGRGGDPLEYNVYARELAAGGVLGDVLPVNASPAGDEGASASVAADADGDFVVAWAKAFDDNVWGRRYDAPYPASRVTSRHVFYNNSAFDGRDAAADARDDAAVAPDKLARLVSQRAVGTQVTNYARGLNGVIVDVARLPGASGRPLGPDDFAVRSGPGTAPSTWRAGPRPVQVAVRRGAGAGGSDRVTLAWPDYDPAEPSAAARADQAVANGWLEITVLANERTGLWHPETFSFGNLIGDAGEGNLEQTASVGGLDLAAVKRALNRPAPVTSVVDFNRDGRTNALDLATVRANLGQTLALPFVAYAGSAYEGFDYPADSHLLGKSGGTGWATPWFYEEGIVRGGGLADPSGTLQTSGNHLGSGGGKRRLMSRFGEDYTEMWVSFLFRKPRGDSQHDAGGLIIGGGVLTSGHSFFVGDPRGGRGEDEIVIGEVGNDVTYLTTGIPAGPDIHLLVVRLQFVPGTERATLYVDPRPGVEPPTGGLTFYGLALEAPTDFVGFTSTVANYDFDELRVGGSYEEVAPAARAVGAAGAAPARPSPTAAPIPATVAGATAQLSSSAVSVLSSDADDRLSR